MSITLTTNDHLTITQQYFLEQLRDQLGPRFEQRPELAIWASHLGSAFTDRASYLDGLTALYAQVGACKQTCRELAALQVHPGHAARWYQATGLLLAPEAVALLEHYNLHPQHMDPALGTALEAHAEGRLATTYLVQLLEHLEATS